MLALVSEHDVMLLLREAPDKDTACSNDILPNSVSTRDARPTPPCPAEKQAALPREKQALPRPAPQKLTKPAGRDGAKLTVDYTDYAHTFGL